LSPVKDVYTSKPSPQINVTVLIDSGSLSQHAQRETWSDVVALNLFQTYLYTFENNASLDPCSSSVDH